MTTRVTVDAHAGWPVAVQPVDDGVAGVAVIVAPHTVQDFAVWSGHSLVITEQPQEKKHGDQQ